LRRTSSKTGATAVMGQSGLRLCAIKSYDVQ
jgi:hypothetical protein